MAQRYNHPVRNHSSRHGAAVTVGVLHTTEGPDRDGIADLEGLAAQFDNPAAAASSHDGNDKDGNRVHMVDYDQKAWTCASANPFTDNLEQVGFAAKSKADWLRNREPQLEDTARWIAERSIARHIPIRRGRVVNCVPVKSGFVGHMDLGPCGGGHHDPGENYPFDYVLDMARLQKYRLQNQHGWSKTDRIAASLLKARLRARRAAYLRHH